MESIRSEPIPFEIDLDALMKQLRVRPGTSDADDLAHLVLEAQKLGRPRFVYGQAFIEDRGDDFVVIAGTRFDSRVLKVNLDHIERVFPFVGTCGMELEEWGNRIEDMLQGFWAEAIKEAALRAALDSFFAHLETRYRAGHISTMSPGSLENWPIGQQVPLFGLLGNPVEVQLTESLLMVPTKSVSGIVFPTDASFESCQLCPRIDCPNRRAPYDETLYVREYCPATK
jgi:hypothetical protein